MYNKRINWGRGRAVNFWSCLFRKFSRLLTHNSRARYAQSRYAFNLNHSNQMAEINFSDLPIGESYVGQDNDEIKIIYERTDADTVSLLCYAPHSDREVMSAFITISTGQTRMRNVDPRFWEITLDGEPIENPTYQEFEKLHTNVTIKNGEYLIELKSKQ